MVKKYYNENGELGILISPGFGAGWSSWSCDEIAFDKRIVESRTRMFKYLEEQLYDELEDTIFQKR